MTRSLTVLAAACVIVVAGGCAAKKPRPQPTVYFSTNITQDGGKFFVYSLEVPERKEASGRKPPSQGMKGGGRGGERGESQVKGKRPQRHDQNKDALKQKVDKLIAENGYCRDGYFVLDRQSGGGMASLRGECQEGATPEDRSRFRNPV